MMQLAVYLLALIAIIRSMDAHPIGNSLKVGMWKRASVSSPHSPSHLSDSVEVYSPVRSTSHMYDDAHYETFPSYHDPTHWTPPSSPIPDKPVSPLRSHDPADIVASKPKRKYTKKSTLNQKRKMNAKVSSFR